MVRRETWLLLIIFTALIGFAIYLNKRAAATEAEATPTGSQIFVFSQDEGLAERIEIIPTEGQSVRIARNSERIWEVQLPFKGAADQGLAEAAGTQVRSLRVLDEIQGAPEIFGLDKSDYVINIEFTHAAKHTLEVGSKTPTNSGYYTRLDKEKMMIVTLSSLDSLLNLVSNPPYLATPTPSPIPATATPNSISGQTTTPTP